MAQLFLELYEQFFLFRLKKHSGLVKIIKTKKPFNPNYMQPSFFRLKVRATTNRLL